MSDTNENYRCCDDYPECDCPPEGMDLSEVPTVNAEPQWGNPEQQMRIDELEKIVIQKEETIKYLESLINTPTIDNFLSGIIYESAHQVERWKDNVDRESESFNWVFLVGHLATRAAAYHEAGNKEKALHHTITTAAVCLNWHRFLKGDRDFFPGYNATKYFHGEPFGEKNNEIKPIDNGNSN